MKDSDTPSRGFAPPLGDMSAEDFERFGSEVIAWISDYFRRIEDQPVLARIEPGEFTSRLPATPPGGGESMETILRDVEELVPPALTHWNHPSFFAYFPTSGSAPGILGELFSAAFDVKALLWRTSPAATELEEVTLSWLRQMMNLPAEFSGIIYDTASVSSMHAIAAARERLDLGIRENGMSGRPDLPLLRVYASDQAHSSIEKALIALGLGQRSLHVIPSDERFAMKAPALAQAIRDDRRAGHLALCVVATIGTTSSSAIDPASAIADICAEHDLWLHVDMAYAGSAAIVPELRHYFDGCERADSIVLNPHKWLFTPFDLSVLYCRRFDFLRRAFALTPDYLRTPEQNAVRSGSDYGVQLGRRFRSLKLWMILRYFGREGLIERIREHCRLARLFASWVEAAPDWELLAPVPFSLVCFRARPAIDGEESPSARDTRLDTLNEAIMHAVNATGEAYLSHTRLNGVMSLRMAIGNIRTTEIHVARAWQLLNEHLKRLKEHHA